MTAVALVTGASAGLGEGFARQLSAKGHRLVLVARRKERLDQLADELGNARAVELDLSQLGAASRLMADVGAHGETVELLVNNAGFGLSGGFGQLDGKRQREMIDLNCGALAELAHAVLPGMIERKSGGILNVASTAAFQPGPGMAVYFATKAFVLSFTESLWEEARGTSLRVLAVNPGATETEFYAAADQSADFGTKRATPQQVVRVALDTLDRRSAPPSVVTNSRPLALPARFLSRRATVRLMGWMARRSQPESSVNPATS